MKMKRIIAYIAATVLALGVMATFAACNDKPAPTVTGIEITTAPAKTKYIAGETFDPTGMVVSKLLSDESKTALTAAEYTYAPNGKLKTSDKNITVTYKDGEESHTATVKISVTNEIANVKILTEPDKKEYITGETFDPTGMTIQAVRQDGTEEAVVTVNPTDVTYNTDRLVAGDSHFEMNYGGFTFYYDMVVKCGAFVEAEAGLIISSGIEVAAGPMRESIDADLEDKFVINSEGTPSVRGIDLGRRKVGDDGNTYTIESIRVDSKYYIHDQIEKFTTTGGYVNQTFLPYKNMLTFKHGKNGQVMYALNGDKEGTVRLVLRMANPVDYQAAKNDTDAASTAAETALANVFEITVNDKKITIPDSVKLAAVDLTQYKRYVPAGNPGDLITEAGQGTYTGEKSIRADYYWQDISVEIPVVNGPNSIILKSVSANDVYVDSISFDGDANKVSLYVESAFAPEVVSAKLKVDNEKVYMGLIVDAKSVGYSEDTVKNVLSLTKISQGERASYKDNVDKGLAGQDTDDPWTAKTDDGGLGYTTAPLNYVHSMDLKNQINSREGVTVEKITEGTYKNDYIVWFDVTIPADSKLGPEPDKNRYLGAWMFYGFNYGADYNNSFPPKDILKSDDGTLANCGSYCYQVYCDARGAWYGFGQRDTARLMLIIQQGTFDETAVTASLPLRKPLLRRYASHWTENDQELIDLRNPKA